MCIAGRRVVAAALQDQALASLLELLPLLTSPLDHHALLICSCMVVVGNGNGVLGWGQGKAAEVNEAVQKVRPGFLTLSVPGSLCAAQCARALLLLSAAAEQRRTRCGGRGIPPLLPTALGQLPPPPLLQAACVLSSGKCPLPPPLQAYHRACRNLYPIPRYNDHTITEAINAKYGQVGVVALN